MLASKLLWPNRTIIIAVALTVLFASIVIIGPRLLAFYEWFWGYRRIYQLFSVEFNWSDNLSSVVATIGSFIYATAWIPLSIWIARILFWKYDRRQLLLGFCAWMAVYAHMPILKLMFDDSCFAKDGTPIKWYVESQDGKIVLFSDGGFDRYGNQKTLVTPEICRRYSIQELSAPRRVSLDEIRDGKIKLFSSTGQPLASYYESADGEIEVFAGTGIAHPGIGIKLLPMNEATALKIKKKLSERPGYDPYSVGYDPQKGKPAPDNATTHKPDSKAGAETPPGSVSGRWRADIEGPLGPEWKNATEDKPLKNDFQPYKSGTGEPDKDYSQPIAGDSGAEGIGPAECRANPDGGVSCCKPGQRVVIYKADPPTNLGKSWKADCSLW